MSINKKTAAALAAAALAAGAASATELPWTGGDATLGDGKVVILCDGNGNVTNIVAKPTGGEELRITGTAMTFAACATIDFAAPAEGAVAGGSLVFANDVTAAGSGFGTATNRVTFVHADGRIERLPLLTKAAVARRIVRFAEISQISHPS